MMFVVMLVNATILIEVNDIIIETITGNNFPTTEK